MTLANIPDEDQWARTFLTPIDDTTGRTYEPIRYPWEGWGYPGYARRSFRAEKNGTEESPVGEPEFTYSRTDRRREMLVFGLSRAHKYILESAFPIRSPLKAWNKLNDYASWGHPWWSVAEDNHPITSSKGSGVPCAFPMSDEAAFIVIRREGPNRRPDYNANITTLFTLPGPLGKNMKWYSKDYQYDDHPTQEEKNLYYRVHFERKCNRVLVYRNMTHDGEQFRKYTDDRSSPYGAAMDIMAYDFIGRPMRRFKFGVWPRVEEDGGDRRFQPWGWSDMDDGPSQYAPLFDRYYFDPCPNLPPPLYKGADRPVTDNGDVEKIKPARLYDGFRYAAREWGSDETWYEGTELNALQSVPFDIIVDAVFWRYRIFRNVKIFDNSKPPEWTGEWDRRIRQDWTFAGAYGRMWIIY